MTPFEKVFAILCAAGIASSTSFGADSPEHGVRYFRSDLGIAPAAPSPLPDRLDSPRTLRWRVATDTGQSTPMLCRGKIFLTSYRNESKELATLALDAETGELLWKR